jgi:hypothetical protein
MRQSNLGFLAAAALTSWLIWASLVLNSASQVGSDLSAVGRAFALVIAMVLTVAVFEVRVRRR